MSVKAKIREYAKALNPMDDTMFCKMAEEKGFCEEVLRVILGDNKLTVLESMPQWVGKNLQGRSVILDTKCMTGDGRQINIEVQKADDDNHQKRVRYNGAVITTNIADPGIKFEFVPDVCVVFISRFDIFKGKLPLYHVDIVIRETGEVINNGFEEVYVNSVVDNGSDVSQLMKVFTEGDCYNDKFPKTSSIKRRYKETEGGIREMSGLIEQLKLEWISEGEKRGEERGEKIGEKRGEEKGKINIAQSMKKKGFDINIIMELTGLSRDKIVSL